MPRKIRIPQSPTQSRINQQRSRARRREHVADLERRVQEYEARDVRASAEMQAAARQVNWKNAQLMELLGSLGWGKEDVERWLLERNSAEGRATNGPAVYQGEYGTSSGTYATTKITTADTYQQASSGEGQSTQTYDDVTSSEKLLTNHEETTSCDEAASMLVSLQSGHTSTAAEVREMLGCCPKSQSEKCQVKNTKLFQLMVETT